MSVLALCLGLALFVALYTFAFDRLFGRCKCSDCGIRFVAYSYHKCPKTGRRKTCR